MLSDSHRDVAQLVAHYVRDVGVGRSSRLIPTTHNAGSNKWLSIQPFVIYRGNMSEVMLTLFAIVVVGYVAGRLGYMGGEFDKRLSSLVINITCPALILSSAMSGELPDSRLILPLLGISTLTYIILAGMALIIPRYLTRKKDDEGVIGFALMFGNVGFMGYPVVASIFGHQAVFYAAVLNVVNTFAVFTIGTILMVGDLGDGKRFQKKVLYSTPMLSAYLAMLIVALGISDIPGVISQPLTMMYLPPY